MNKEAVTKRLQDAVSELRLIQDGMELGLGQLDFVRRSAHSPADTLVWHIEYVEHILEETKKLISEKEVE